MVYNSNMNLIDFDDFVLSHIITFIDLHENYNMTLIAPNKRYQQLCKYLLFNYKTKNPIYEKVLQYKRSNIDIDNLKLIFFKISSFRNNFKEFRNYIFHIFDNINQNEFGLITRMEKICYIKKINKNCALMLLYHDKVNVYYSLYYRIPFKDTQNNTNTALVQNNSGYIYYNNNLIVENENIIKYI